MISLSLLIVIAALVCLFLAAINVTTSRINLLALGLFLWLAWLVVRL